MITNFAALTFTALLNFTASVVQRVTGVDDALLLHACWYTACRATPHVFLRTPLGDDSVRAVVTMMYVRLLANAPLLVYLDFSTGVFSRSMTVMMGLSSTLFAVLGAYLFVYLTPRALAAVLGVSCVLFAACYGGLICLRALRVRWRVGEAQRRGIVLVREADALADELGRSRGASVTELQSTFAQHLPHTHLPFLPLHRAALFAGEGKGGCATTSCGVDEHPTPPLAPARVGDVAEAYTSTITGDLFTAPEAVSVQLSEENVPPLTPSKVSPLRTMPFTRVRINRNVDAEGKVRTATKVGAVVAAAVGGLFASLTAVSGPPRMIFATLFDTPHYLVDVSFSAQSVPGGLARVLVALQSGVLEADQLPMLICAVLFSYVGLLVGSRVGRRLGPRSSGLLAVCMLLLSTLTTANGSAGVVLFAGVAAGTTTVAVAYWEARRCGPAVVTQMRVEEEIVRRTCGAVDFLQRNRSILPAPTHPATLHAARLSQPADHTRSSQMPTQPGLMWGRFDNDEDEDTEANRCSATVVNTEGTQRVARRRSATPAATMAEVRDSETLSLTVHFSATSIATAEDDATPEGRAEEALNLSID